MGRKQPEVSHDRRFVLQEERATKLVNHFQLGEHYTTDEAELGELVCLGKSVLQSELSAAMQIPSG